MSTVDELTADERADFYQMQFEEEREVRANLEVEIERLHDELGDVDAERRRLVQQLAERDREVDQRLDDWLDTEGELRLALADETAQRLELAGRLVESENGRIEALADVERLSAKLADVELAAGLSRSLDDVVTELDAA